MIMILFLTFALASILAFFLACFRVHVCAVTSRACDEVGGCIWSLLAVSSGSIGAHPQSHPTRRKRRRRGGGGRGGVAPLSKSRDPHLAGGKEEKQHTWFWIKEKTNDRRIFFYSISRGDIAGSVGTSYARSYWHDESIHTDDLARLADDILLRLILWKISGWVAVIRLQNQAGPCLWFSYLWLFCGDLRSHFRNFAFSQKYLETFQVALRRLARSAIGVCLPCLNLNELDAAGCSWMESCHVVPFCATAWPWPIDSGLFNVLAKGAEETSDDFLAPALYHQCAGQLNAIGIGRTCAWYSSTRRFPGSSLRISSPNLRPDWPNWPNLKSARPHLRSTMISLCFCMECSQDTARLPRNLQSARNGSRVQHFQLSRAEPSLVCKRTCNVCVTVVTWAVITACDSCGSTRCLSSHLHQEVCTKEVCLMVMRISRPRPRHHFTACHSSTRSWSFRLSGFRVPWRWWRRRWRLYTLILSHHKRIWIVKHNLNFPYTDCSIHMQYARGKHFFRYFFRFQNYDVAAHLPHGIDGTSKKDAQLQLGTATTLLWCQHQES